MNHLQRNNHISCLANICVCLLCSSYLYNGYDSILQKYRVFYGEKKYDKVFEDLSEKSIKLASEILKITFDQFMERINTK